MTEDPRETDHAREAHSLEEDGIPPMEGDPPQKQAVGLQEEGIIAPGDDPTAVEDYGTTAFEQAEGEPHALRLLREAPEDEQEENGSRSVRLVGDADDDTRDVTASSSADTEALSAEEEAVRETDEPERR